MSISVVEWSYGTRSLLSLFSWYCICCCTVPVTAGLRFALFLWQCGGKATVLYSLLIGRRHPPPPLGALTMMTISIFFLLLTLGRGEEPNYNYDWMAGVLPTGHTCLPSLLMETRLPLTCPPVHRHLQHPPTPSQASP